MVKNTGVASAGRFGECRDNEVLAELKGAGHD
jgi:hypothetical protein